MVKRVNKYLIMATENYGRRRTLASFNKKSRAKKELKRLLRKGKTRMVHGKRIRLTSYRGGYSGSGITNPRIKKIRGFA